MLGLRLFQLVSDRPEIDSVNGGLRVFQILAQRPQVQPARKNFVGFRERRLFNG